MNETTTSPLDSFLRTDPRTQNIDPQFHKLISNIARAFGRIAQVKGRRATHSYGTVAKGTLTVLPSLTIPEHRLFHAGQSYPVLIRHANIKGFRDDAILDGRGATLRILSGKVEAPLKDLNLYQGILDVLMSTGRSFILANALSFAQWAAGDLKARAIMLEKYPKIIPIFHEIIRDPSSYTCLHYYSETTYHLLDTQGKSYFLRYRLVNHNHPEVDEGWIAPERVKMPLDYLPRVAGDSRPESYLQDDFKAKVCQTGVQYRLQFQIQPITGNPEIDERAKDCTIPWNESNAPFQDVAVIDLNQIVPEEVSEGLEFNPYHAPTELGLILANSAQETASVNHLRSVVYEISAQMRKYQMPTKTLVDWGTERTPSPKEQYPYAGDPGKTLPSFDARQDLPMRVQPKPRYFANFGLHLMPAQPLGPLPELGIKGVLELMDSSTTQYMPPNLTRTHFDKFSDAFFVERRLNGFNPGKLNRVDWQSWQYEVHYDCSRLGVEASGILASDITARFTLNHDSLQLHSIQYKLNGKCETNQPGDQDWEWAKRLFRCSEFVFQEIQSHLGRTHMNMDQYAMAYYRNVVNHPIKLLLEPHLDGLLSINKLGASLIKGETGFIPEASSLTSKDVDKVLFDEVASLSYKQWSPRTQALPDRLANNYFDPAAIAVWDIITSYVCHFFNTHESGITAHWSEIVAMSEDLVSHSILKPELGSLAISSINDLQALCRYVIYHSTFFHSWVNNKQYEDGGDVSYATIGLWDSHHPAYNPIEVAEREAKQTTLLWTLSHVRYNPIMDVGPTPLKDALWQRRDEIEPGIPLANLMMSINI